MADEIVGSHLKANNSYGQGGYQGASSLNPGETKAPIADVSPKTCDVPGLDAADQLGARVKPTAYNPTFGLGKRGVDAGSPGGSVPAATSHTSRR